MAALAIGLGGAIGELWVQDGLLLCSWFISFGIDYISKKIQLQDLADEER